MTVTLANRQRKIQLAVPWLRRFTSTALVYCLEHSDDGRFALRALPELDVAIVSDRVIARVHQQFMNIPGPTDVITFAHGEIVMSAQTASAHAGEQGHTVEKELALYTVHGMLHLNGFEDTTSEEAARMHRVQDRIWRQCLDELPPPTAS